MPRGNPRWFASGITRADLHDEHEEAIWDAGKLSGLKSAERIVARLARTREGWQRVVLLEDVLPALRRAGKSKR